MTQETEADRNVRNAAAKLSGAVHASQQATQEIVGPNDQYVAYARKVTEEIKTATEDLVRLLHQMQDEELWRHLGYNSWKAYIDAEFDFSERRSYQLLRYDRVLKALDDGTDVQSSDEIHISEAESRGVDLEGDVMSQVRDVRQRVAEGKAAKQAAEPRTHEHRFVCSVCNITTAQAAKDKTLFTDEARSGGGS